MEDTIIASSEFKANCSSILREVASLGRTFVVTKRGRPIARVVPIESGVETLFGSERGSVTIRGDIVAPIQVPWEAME